jgi:hypothetical protein
VRRKVDYIIKASVDTVELRASDGPTMKGLCEIPRFTVKAGGVREAESLAKDIIDPLHMTDRPTPTSPPSWRRESRGATRWRRSWEWRWAR